MGHWQPLSPVGITVPIYVGSVGHRDVVLDLPYKSPASKENKILLPGFLSD